MISGCVLSVHSGQEARQPSKDIASKDTAKQRHSQAKTQPSKDTAKQRHSQAKTQPSKDTAKQRTQEGKDMEPLDDDEWYLSNIKQRPSRLNPKKIGTVVRLLMARSGYGQVQANEELLMHWERAAGEVLARNTRPGNIKRGVLTIHVADSSSLQELAMCKREILLSLQQNFPQANIKEIRGRVTQF